MSLLRQLVDQLLRTYPEPGLPIEIERIGNQRQIDQRRQRQTTLTTSRGVGIRGQPPATVEGLTPGRHLDSLYKRLKAAERCHGMQLIHMGIKAGEANIEHLTIDTLRQTGR